MYFISKQNEVKVIIIEPKFINYRFIGTLTQRKYAVFTLHFYKNIVKSRLVGRDHMEGIDFAGFFKKLCWKCTIFQ